MTTLKSVPPKGRPASAPAPDDAGKAGVPGSGGLGARLRLARERSGATVRGLARAVGVSPSLVSQIELGRVMPSVGTLYALTNELGLLLDDVFKEGGEGPIRTAVPASDPVQRHSTRRALRLASGVRWELLTTEPDDDLEFLYVVYDVGGESCAEASMMRHGGKEYAYLISGRLGVKVGFKEFELGPGDSMSFNAQSPHRLWAIGKQPAVAVWAVLNRHGDQRSMVAAPDVLHGTPGKA